jgi:dihydroflavonol-4-reductase
MSHLLITGANGFIGSHLVRYLLALRETEGWQEEIVCLVRSTSDLSSLRGLDVKLVIGDLRRPESLVKAVEGAVYIYHLAAELYTISRQRFRETNTQGTENLLKAAAAGAKSTLKRFLFVSSQAAAGPASDETPITEEREPPPPVSHYAESKLDAERIVMQYAKDLSVTIVRPSAVYGERDQAFVQAFKSAEMHVHAVTGFRKRYTSMVYAPDLVEGMVAAARHPDSVGQIYFLANPEGYSVRDAMRTVGEAVGKPWGIPLPVPIFAFRAAAIFQELLYLFTRKEPIPSRDKVRDLSQIYWLCNPKKAGGHFGWTAKTSLLEGMKLTYRYIKEDERRLKKMPGESKNILWLKYFFVALALGIVIEGLSAFGKLYQFQPWWLVFPVVLMMWGVVLGSIAMALRTRGFLIQYLPGFALLFGAEILSHYWLHAWEFSGGSLFGITNPVLRALVLGVIAGFGLPVINAVMRQFYKVRLRLG